jgi:rhodanese-related sulfurtransferase
MKTLILIILSSIGSSLLTAGIVVSILHAQDNPIAEYYTIENAVQISPHWLRKKIETHSNTSIIVDLRSEEEYKEAHIKWAINIPAYRDKDTNAYDQVDRIVGEFRQLPRDTEIIVYCYSRACMTGRKVGKMLAEEWIYVKHLGIGWNEWRYDWKSWNHPHEWDITDPMDYIEWTSIVPKTSTGVVPAFNITPCSVDSTLGC